MILNEHQMVASITRDSFYEFFLEFWKQIIDEPLVPNWHIKYLCDELQAIAERVFKRIPNPHDTVVNVPPGSSKSTIISQMFPAWVWTRMPEAQFICVSYAERVALKDALRMRDIVECELYQKCFPQITLREDLNTKGLFKNKLRGYRLSAGLGGQITGEHGHFLLVDDPLDPEQSYSEAELRAVNRFMDTTLPSRKVDKLVTTMIVVQQRLHQSDPSGELLDPARGKSIKHICLPGEIRTESTIKVAPAELEQFYKDGLLDPVRLPKVVLEKMEKDLGAYGYSSQILQDPVPLGGGQIQTDKIQIVQAPPDVIVKRVRAWDKAGTKDGGAYSVGVEMGFTRSNQVVILDVVRGQWGSIERERTIKQCARIDGIGCPILIEIEGGSGGKESGEETVRNLMGYRVITFHPTGDKESRAYPFSSQVGGGNVYCLNKPWTRDYISELRFFPHSKYKDQVDATSSAFNYLAAVKPKRRAGAF